MPVDYYSALLLEWKITGSPHQIQTHLIRKTCTHLARYEGGSRLGIVALRPAVQDLANRRGQLLRAEGLVQDRCDSKVLR